jgi:hypothetical protein
LLTLGRRCAPAFNCTLQLEKCTRVDKSPVPLLQVWLTSAVKSSSDLF